MSIMGDFPNRSTLFEPIQHQKFTLIDLNWKNYSTDAFKLYCLPR